MTRIHRTPLYRASFLNWTAVIGRCLFESGQRLEKTIMLLSRDTVNILVPLAQTAYSMSNILFEPWPHQLNIISNKLSETGNVGITDTIAEIKNPLKEIKRLLPTSTGFVLNQWCQSHPQLDQQIQEDAVLLLNNWKKLIKICGLVAKLLETIDENEFKRLSNNVAKKLREIASKKEITEFIEEYCNAVGAIETLAEDTLEKIEKMSAGFEKVSGG